MRRHRVSKRTIVIVGTVVALVLAGFVSYYASADPDGLNKVAAQLGFDSSEREHATSDGPLAGYAVSGVGDERLSGGLAGVIGVLVTFAIAGGLFVLLRRLRPSRDKDT